MSSGVKFVYGRGLRRQRQTVIDKLNKTSKQLKESSNKRQRTLAALSFADRDAFMSSGNPIRDQDVDMDELGGMAAHEGDAIDESDEEVEMAFRRLPPGEESLLQSHEGGEAMLDNIMSDIHPRYIDSRTRKSRVQEMVDSWRRQISHLTDAYLAWKSQGVPANEGACYWQLETHSIFSRNIQTFYHPADASYVNETLIRFGFIGATPERPTVAFSIEVFELYHQLHRVCPRLSIQAVTRALSHLHGSNHKNHYAEQFSTAYDCYLAILHEVQKRSNLALNRDDSWQMKNVCPPCLYKIEHETPLKYSLLVTMDGNNSLKLVDATFRAGTPRKDDRTLSSPRWLTPEQVDVFKDEVAKSAPAKETRPTNSSLPVSTLPPASTSSSNSVPLPDLNNDEDVAWLNVTENDETLQNLNVCVERWKSAGPEARKKMFALFAIAGVFLAVCRHGHVLVICDMIRSGELMKYPLAIVERLLNQYGSDIGLGYDIMCAFVKTLAKSSLGSRMIALNLQGVVPAFHGHAHNRGCQVYWHPMYMEGVGIEDFEECERTFAKSNDLAAVTRLATPFHRHQQIEEFFKFHDADKHASSGNFIYENYRQALERIRINGETLAKLSVKLGTTGADYERYLTEEREYLKGLKTEPVEVLFTIDYMDLLTKLQQLHSDSEDAKKEFKKLDYYIIAQGIQASQIRNIRTRYRTTYSKWEACHELICRFEEEHGIVERWTPSMKEYNDALVLLAERKYRRALDELERLVVQRLLEMTKLGMNGVGKLIDFLLHSHTNHKDHPKGYRLRDKIGRALKTRSDAIATALRNYNEAATLLNPPRERLTWTTVIQAATLADFDLLRDARKDIRTLPWTEPLRREAMSLYFGIKRAHEEVQRLNIEICRLTTFMVDEHVDYYHAIANTLFVDPPLASYLSRKWQHHSETSTHIAHRLHQTSQLVGFSGSLEPGQRTGRASACNASVPLPDWAIALRIQQGTLQRSGEEESAAQGDVDVEAVVQFMESLT